jgi:hypothetical protein
MPENDKSINEYVFEIRYKPNARILDHRGTWAELISAHMSLPEWRIAENRVDIFDKENKNHCFVGFKNSGFVTRDSPTANYFPDQVVKFFRFVLSLEGFGKTLSVERIGVRARFLTPYSGPFVELVEHYTNRYLKLTEAAQVALAAKLVDIGGNLNFVDSHGNFNTVTGPMARDQISQFFEWKENLPSVGLYFDVDYWLKPKKPLSESEILKHIGSFSKESWERHERICKVVMGE